jgi:hypothetical protein
VETLVRARELIAEIRNSRNLETNLAQFFGLMSERQSEILASFDIRWLVSICDTYADHGSEVERRNALLVSMFVNLLRLAETHRFLSGPIDSARLEVARGDPIELYEGVSTFSIDRQDVYLNLSKRMARVMPSTPFLYAIWKKIVQRLHSCPNAISVLSSLSQAPERYFPEEPLALPDNYGVR